MEDEPRTRIDHPEQLCNAIVGLIDELEDSDLIGAERASELRSEVYRSIDISSENSE
jgi:hypothetical protein